MKCEYIFIRNLTWFLFLLLSERPSGESENDYSKGCAYLRCENGSQCVKRRFWCKDPPCPGMLYCSKSRRESLKGPLTCDTVRCSRGYKCIVKVQGCHWDGKCKQQRARCVSEREYYEGAASCAGFKCPSGERCILRETYCVNPPCKLIGSCRDAEDVQIWFDECRDLNCTSGYECFLRRPENNCHDRWCMHTPDCTLTVEEELISKYCYGWICPRAQKCVVRIIGSCTGFNCTIERSCRASSVLSTKQDTNANNMIDAEQLSARKTLVQIERELICEELERGTNTQTTHPIAEEESTSPATSTRRETIRRTTPKKPGTEVSLTHQQIATKKLNLIAEPLESSTREPYLTQPYPRSRLNLDRLSTIDGGKVFQSSTSLTLLVDVKIEPTTSCDTERLELPRKIYVATDDTLPLPMASEDINFIGQGYPIWINSDPYPSLKVKYEDGWGYHAPQEPYKILLPPYEPVILVEDTRRREQFLPFFTYAFDHSFNEAALSLPEITPTGMRDSKTDITSTTTDGKTVSYINNSMIVEIENIKTNHFDDSSGDYVTEKTSSASPSTRDKELDNYYDDNESRSRYMIHNYPERNEPQSSHEQESKSSIIDLATDDFYRNDTLADTEMSTGSRITDEKRSRATEMLYVDGRNKNLATFSPPASTGRSDYSSRDERLHGLANYPYDTISVHHVDKSSREYGGSSLKRVSDVSSNEEGNQRDIPITFPLGELFASQANGRPVTPFPNKASPYYTRNNNGRSSDRLAYDEYYSHGNYYNVSSIKMTGS